MRTGTRPAYRIAYRGGFVAPTTSTRVPTGNTYDKYTSTNPFERRLMAGFFLALGDMLPSSVPQRVLEVGVGEGEVAQRISTRWPELAPIGLDLPDPGLVDRWRTTNLVPTFGDVGCLPFRDGTFDLVLAIEVLEHVADADTALAEIARVARNLVIVSVPREPIWRIGNVVRGKYLRDLGNTPGHVQHWSTRAFTELVATHLQVERVSTPLPWTMVQARGAV